MKSIKLSVVEKTSTNCSRVNVEVDDSDVGVLYLKDSELETLTAIINTGCDEHEVEFDFLNTSESHDDYVSW